MSFYSYCNSKSKKVIANVLISTPFPVKTLTKLDVIKAKMTETLTTKAATLTLYTSKSKE